jgi:hypothetical protein
MKIRLLAFVSFFLAFYSTKAQTANDFVVSGYVYDFNDTTGIADYRVMLFEADTTGGGNDLMVEMITDANGYYSYVIPNGSVSGTNRNYKILLVGCSGYEDEVEAMNTNGSTDSYNHDFYICFYESCQSPYVYLTTDNGNGTHNVYVYSSNDIIDNANYSYTIQGYGSQIGSEPAIFFNIPEGVYTFTISMSGLDCGFTSAVGSIKIPKYNLQDCDATFTYNLNPANNSITCTANNTEPLLSDWWNIYDPVTGGGGGSVGNGNQGDVFTLSDIPYGTYNFIIGHTVGGGDTGCWESTSDTVLFDNTDGSICDPNFFNVIDPIIPFNQLIGVNQPGINHIWIYGTDTISTDYSCTIYYIQTFEITHIVYDNNGCSVSLTDTIGYYGSVYCTSDFYILPANTNNPNEYNISSGATNLLNHTWILDGDTIGHNYNFNIELTGPQSHTICLIVSGDSCSDTSCQQINPDNNTLLGTVYYEDLMCGNCINDATAYLYKIQNTDTSTIGILMGTTDVVNNHFEFTNMENGNYIVRAALDSTNSEFDNYLPTYNETEEFWQSCYLIGMYGLYDQQTQIRLLSVVLNPGSGLIGGGVVIEDTLRDMAGENVTVFIKNTSGVITKYDLTNSNGNFQLTNLAFGTYTLYADLPGYTCVPQTITIGASNPSVSDVELHLYPSIILGVPNQPEVVAEIGSPYPNPTQGNITIPVTAKKTSQLAITIYNLLGQSVLNQNNTVGAGNQTIQLPTESLAKGIYILQIADRKTGATVTKKIVKD